MLVSSPSARAWLREYVNTHPLARSTEGAYEYALNAFEKWFKRAVSLQELADNLSEWVRYRCSVRKPDGVKTQRGALITLLRAAAEAGHVCLPLRIRTVKLTDLEPTWFSDDELRCLLLAADQWQRAAILVVRSTTVRRGDVFSVRWSQVDAASVLRFVMNKPGQKHALKISPDALNACFPLRQKDDDRLIPWPLSKGAWHDRWLALGKRAGVIVHRRGLQAIRRSAASLVAKEHGEFAAARLLGHAASSGVTVFRRYYAIGDILDETPPSPPPLLPPEERSA